MTELIDKSRYRTLTFDCYGTLIDRENGLLGHLQPLLESYDVHVLDEWVLDFFATHEPRAQAGGGSYRSVLGQVLQAFGSRLAFTPTDEIKNDFAESIEYWQPFPDTLDALQRLARHFDLAIVCNVDRDLFEYSNRQLGVTFSEVITAGDIGEYKPSAALFDSALARVQTPALHVAQSHVYDIAPARAQGLDTVWINRPSVAANQPADTQPDWKFTSLDEFANAIGV